MAYIILVNDDNTMYGSHKERIMQRSKLVDDLIFVVPQIYKNKHDMANATVMMEYLLPSSKRYKTERLVLSDERYKDCFLQYKLPLDTTITSEAGSVELQLTFAYVELDENGKGIQRVRKISPTAIEITPISAWADIIPDEVLSPLDQRILKQDAQIRALADLAYLLNDNQVDNLVYDSKEDVLHLSAKGVRVGDKVSVKEIMDDGIPVVDLDSNGDSDSNTKPEDGCDCGCEHEDNVVEFGDSDIVEKLEDDNVVEF